MSTIKRLSAFLLLLLCCAGLPHAARAQQAAPSCQAQSGRSVPIVVELYTSEGCDACPPAERWLSGIKDRPGVLAAAFHVDYWDRLGWTDRFARPAHTARQAQSLAYSGARFAYTPQLIVNGRDWRGNSLPVASTATATVTMQLLRLGDEQVRLSLQSPVLLRLWWAVLEDGQQTAVKAGENRGVTLRHDALVRDYGSVNNIAAGTQVLSLKAASKGEDGRPRRLLVVATDPASGLVLQALQLGC